MTFYIKTDEPKFTKTLKHELESRGLHEGEFPVSFMFVSGKHAYQRNLSNTKGSQLTNLASTLPITDKAELHKKFKGSNFIKDFEIIQRVPEFEGIKILKPSDGYAGKDITIVHTPEEAKKWLETHRSKSWLLQEYIIDPALKDGHKFHLRVPILMVKNKVYVFKSAQYYLAKSPYSKTDLSTNIHDTHYNPEFEYMYPTDLPDGWKRPKNIYAMFATVFKGLSLKPDWNSKNAFYLFGADVMFDKRKPILLEVNDQIGLKDMEFVIPGMLGVLLDGSHPDFIKMD